MNGHCEMRERYDMGIVVTNIQRMCFHDGPGIRTTVFLKGCGIHCPWCANPENISFQIQSYSQGAFSQVIRQYGREYETEDLLHILEKDRGFWGKDGGVTFSGGEPLLQAVALLDVWKRLKEKQIQMVAETSLFVPMENVRMAMDYMDFFYVDVKLLEPKMCEQVLGGKKDTYLQNVQLLAERKKKIHFRIPCSEEYVLVPENLDRIYAFLEKYRQYPVEIFAVHNLGDNKYHNLNLEPKRFQPVTEEHLKEVCKTIRKLGVAAEIIRI